MQVMDYLKAINFEITQGTQFMWDCYGADAWFLESDATAAVIDTKNGTVYEISGYDEENNDCFKWINPDYESAYTTESENRGYRPWQAYDDVDYRSVSESQILDLISRLST